MNEKRLLFWLTEIADEYVLEAVEHFRTAQRRPRRMSRLLVIAAVLAAMLAVAAVGYGVSQSIYAKKQEQLRLEYMPHGQKVPSYVEFTPTEEEITDTHIELLSTARTYERLQETEYAITSDDPVLLEALIYGFPPVLRCAEARVWGSVKSWDEENNTAYFALQIELPTDAKVGDVYAVELWARHSTLWVPEDDPEAQPVASPSPGGNWDHPLLYTGALEVVVTELYSARVEFGDSLPVELEDGTAYIRSAKILPSEVSWLVELPRAYYQYDVPDPMTRRFTEEFLRMGAAVSEVLGRGAVFFDDGGCWLVGPDDFGGICDENGTIYEGDEGGIFYRTGCYYSGLQNIPAVTGMALGDLFYPANQTYDPAAVQSAPDYPRNPYR